MRLNLEQAQRLLAAQATMCVEDVYDTDTPGRRQKSGKFATSVQDEITEVSRPRRSRGGRGGRGSAKSGKAIEPKVTSEADDEQFSSRTLTPQSSCAALDSSRASSSSDVGAYANTGLEGVSRSGAAGAAGSALPQLPPVPSWLQVLDERGKETDEAAAADATPQNGARSRLRAQGNRLLAAFGERHGLGATDSFPEMSDAGMILATSPHSGQASLVGSAPPGVWWPAAASEASCMDAAYCEGLYAALTAGNFLGHDPGQDAWSWTSMLMHMDNPDFATLAMVFCANGHGAHVHLDHFNDAVVESPSASMAQQDRSPHSLLAAPPGL